MISYALIANGQHNPYLATPLPEHMVYPISQRCRNGIDLDYSALIIGEQFFVDDAVYEDVISSRKEYLKPMKHSFRVLSESGLLQKKEYTEYFKNNKNKIKNLTDNLLNEVDFWLQLEQIQWRTLKSELVDFQATYGSHHLYHVNTSNIGIESWLARTDQIYNNQLRKDLYLLFEGKKTIEDVGIENTRGALQFIVAQIVMSDLISHSLKAPILDWDDAKGMYERIYSMQWSDFENDISLKREAKKLVEVITPSLKPDNINQVVKFVCDNSAVSSFRQTLLNLIENGETVSPEWMSEYVNKIMAEDLAIQHKSSIFQILGTLVGLIPGTWIQSAAVSGTTSLLDKCLFRRKGEYNLSLIHI